MKKIMSLALVLIMALQLLPVFTAAANIPVTVWDGSIAASYENGTGTEQDPFIIADGAQLARMAQQVNNGAESGFYYRLGNDIDLGNQDWTPIGGNTATEATFSGYFDGNAHTIRNMHIQITLYSAPAPFDTGIVPFYIDPTAVYPEEEKSAILNEMYLHTMRLAKGELPGLFSAEPVTLTADDRQYVGLFGVLASGSITNLVLEDSLISGGYNTGGFVGQSEAGTLIENCFVVSSSLNNASNRGALGGIAGYTYGQIVNCHNMGTNVYSNGANRVGGIAGEAQGNIIGCTNNGDITTYSPGFVGGIVGVHASLNGEVDSCYNEGTVVNAAATFAGGIAGNKEIGTITRCGNAGNVLIDVYSGIAGGVAGVASYMTYSYNTGTVTAGAASGLAAYFYTGGAMKNYTTGMISSGISAGAITCYVGPTVDISNGNYWLAGSAQRDIVTRIAGGRGNGIVESRITLTNPIWIEYTLGLPFIPDTLDINNGYAILDTINYDPALPYEPTLTINNIQSYNDVTGTGLVIDMAANNSVSIHIWLDNDKETVFNYAPHDVMAFPAEPGTHNVYIQAESEQGYLSKTEIHTALVPESLREFDLLEVLHSLTSDEYLFVHSDVFGVPLDLIEKLMCMEVFREYTLYNNSNHATEEYWIEVAGILTSILGREITPEGADWIQTQYDLYSVGMFSPEMQAYFRNEHYTVMRTLITMLAFNVATSLNPFNSDGTIKYTPQDYSHMRNLTKKLPAKTKIKFYQSAGSANMELSTSNPQPPYKVGTYTAITEAQQNVSSGRFVRVFTEGVTQPQGQWFMYADDIAGLTPQQIQNKFALPYTPTHMVDVAIPEGTQIRYGYANSLYGNEGGGLQFDFMGTHIDGFVNARPLP